MNAEPPIVITPSTVSCPRNEGSIVLGWLTKLVITISLLGVLAFDGVALVQARFAAADHAAAAARVAATTLVSSKNEAIAKGQADAVALQNGETLESVVFDSISGQATVTLHKTATTLWMHRIGFLKKYVVVSAVGTGTPPL